MKKIHNIYSYPRALKLYLYILIFNNFNIFNQSEKVHLKSTYFMFR